MFLQSFWKASYINSHADGFYPAPARETPRLSPAFTFTPYYRLCYTTLKDAFHCAPTSHRIRSMRLSCSHGNRKVNLPPSHFLLHKRDLPVDHSRSPITRPSRYENLFILLFLNFLFSFYDNASTFTFYTSDVVSNFVSLSFRHEETHEAITFPLWKTKPFFFFLYITYIANSFGTQSTFLSAFISIRLVLIKVSFKNNLLLLIYVKLVNCLCAKIC